MLNDRNDMPEDHEENEYHFSDEDVSYDVETESSKPASAQTKEGIANRLAQSKRMLISLGVFLVLVFVVYKLVTPSTTNVVTDISTPVTATENNAPSSAMSNQAPSQQPAQPVVAQQPVQHREQPAVVASQPPEAVVPSVEVAVTPSVPEEAQQPVAAMPSVIPVQPQSATLPAESGGQPVVASPSVEAAPMQNNVVPPSEAAITASPSDAAAARLAETTERLMAQLQSDYTQKMNDYALQNKALQDQMQTLNARVATMEAQLSQIIQAITPPANQAPAALPSHSIPANKPVVAVPEPKITYNVQAIIPGRAWLRAENGDAITVAEGDTIRDLGRVTKIDPYDGIVEVNTGNRTVTLSYGNTNE